VNLGAGHSPPPPPRDETRPLQRPDPRHCSPCSIASGQRFVPAGHGPQQGMLSDSLAGASPIDVMVAIGRRAAVRAPCSDFPGPWRGRCLGGSLRRMQI